MQLKNKTIIITGASEGLGKAIALRLAKEGNRLILLSRSKTKLHKAAEEISKIGPKPMIEVCDITSLTSIGRAVKKIKKSAKRIDILINNAGIWIEGKTEDADDKRIQTVFNTNVVGHILFTKRIIPLMKKQKSGHILNVISLAGIEPSAEWGIYTSSKYAMRGFTDSLRLELEKSGIKVSGFYPGGINTNIFKNAGYNYINQSWMMNKDNIAEIVVFMLTQPKDMLIDYLSVRKF